MDQGLRGWSEPRRWYPTTNQRPARCSRTTSLRATPPSRTSTRVRTTAACFPASRCSTTTLDAAAPGRAGAGTRPLRVDEVVAAHAVAQLVAGERPQRVEVEAVPRVLVRDGDVVGRRPRIACEERR